MEFRCLDILTYEKYRMWNLHVIGILGFVKASSGLAVGLVESGIFWVAFSFSVDG